MIPLAIFLIVWLVFLAIFLFISALSILQMLRFGLKGLVTTMSTALFVAVSAGIIIVSLVLLSDLNLNGSIDMTEPLGDVLLLN